jgi:hypothetical protein
VKADVECPQGEWVLHPFGYGPGSGSHTRAQCRVSAARIHDTQNLLADMNTNVKSRQAEGRLPPDLQRAVPSMALVQQMARLEGQLAQLVAHQQLPSSVSEAAAPVAPHFYQWPSHPAPSVSAVSACQPAQHQSITLPIIVRWPAAAATSATATHGKPPPAAGGGAPP